METPDVLEQRIVHSGKLFLLNLILDPPSVSSKIQESEKLNLFLSSFSSLGKLVLYIVLTLKIYS